MRELSALFPVVHYRVYTPDPHVCLSDVGCTLCTIITTGVHCTCGDTSPQLGSDAPIAQMWRLATNIGSNLDTRDAKYDEGKLSFTIVSCDNVDLLTISGVYNLPYIRTRHPFKAGLTPALSQTQSQAWRRLREAEWRIRRSVLQRKGKFDRNLLNFNWKSEVKQDNVV